MPSVADEPQIPLRVLHVIASVDLTTGGPVEGIIQSLKFRNSTSFEVVSLDAPDALCIKSFPGIVHGVGPATLKYRYTPKLARWIIANGSKFDAAIIHGLWNHASIGGWQGCRTAGLPYVVFPHGMMDPWFRKAYPLKHWIKQLFWWIQGRVLRDASEVLFTCEEEKLLAQGVFFGFHYKPCTVAYAAADAAAFSIAETSAFQASVPELRDRPYLLFIGRVHEKKGCDLLIEGFSRAVKRQDLQLVIAGPVSERLGSSLKNMAKLLGVSDRIHWAGMITGEAKAGAFRGADAFVLTSHQENFGIAVAEALAYGRPVLISDQVNIWREIESGCGGFVAPDTIDGATQIITKWEQLSNQERQQMAKAARAVYERNFTVSAAARDLNNALLRAAQASTRYRT